MRKMIIIVFFLVLIDSAMHAVDIGSDTKVTRFNTQQIVEDGDRIAGFAALAAGFALDNPSTAGTFDSFFSVAGNVSFRFGTLELDQDLIFHNVTEIVTLGNIIGNFHVVELASTIDCIPGISVDSFCAISLLTGVATADNVQSVGWTSGDDFVAVGMANNAGNEVQVYSWDGTTLTSITGVSLGDNVNSVNWHPTLDRLAVGRDSAAGDELYLYSFNGVTLTLLDSVNIGGGGGNNVNSVAFDPSGDYLAVGTDSNAQELIVYDVSAGTFGASVTINLPTDANAVSWDTTGGFLAVGTDNNGGGSELFVYAFTTGPLALTLDSSFNVGQIVNTLDWNKGAENTDLIAVGVPSGTNRLHIYRHSTGSLTKLTLTIAVGRAVLSTQWRNDGVCIAAGLQNNSEGTGREIRLYAFSDDDLIQEDDVEIGSNTNAVRWSHDGSYMAAGDNGPSLDIYQLDPAFFDISNVIFSDVGLTLNANVTFREPSITFSGQSAINGRGNTITLSPSFSLIVNEGGSLLLEDVTIKGVNNSKIRGLDERSTFSLLDAKFVLDGDYTFAEGKLDILEDFTISGTHTFNYTAEQQSTIRGGRFGTDGCAPAYCGSLIIDNRTTFSYAPTNNSNSLLEMESEISKLILNGGNLHANELILTNGTFQAFGRSAINASSLTFGDGTEANNLCIDIKGAQLEVMGNLINNNV
jgi:WD40 repeat protein